MTSAPEVETRGVARGRPRSVEVEGTILAAALDVLADHGFGGFTVEAVAARAGVAKTTIYRRHVGREELLLAALTRLREELPVPPVDGTVRERLRVQLDGIRGHGAGTRNARIMLHVAGQQHPELMRAYYTAVVEPRTTELTTILRDGVNAGEIRPDLDPATAVPMLVGSVVFLRMWRPCASVAQPTTDELVDALLQGLGA